MVSSEVFEATSFFVVVVFFFLSLNINQPQGQLLPFWLLPQVYPTAELPCGRIPSLLRPGSGRVGSIRAQEND